MSETKFNTDHVEQLEVSPARGGAGSKVKRHCARWWWVHLIIFCASFLIIALCLVYVAMPKIAQDGVDDASLEFTELQFLNPSATSVTLTQRAILHSPSKFTPTLDSFNASTFLVTNGTFGAAPMIFVTMPSIHVQHPKSNVAVEDSKVMINNMDQLTNFATQAVAQEYVSTALVGETTLHLGALPTVKINYNSTSKYKGLNALKGFNVTGARIDLLAKPGQQNLKGFAYVPNPSLMTIQLGNVSLSLSTEKAGKVGTTTINDMTLKPGNNTLPLFGTMDQAKVVGSLDGDGMVELLITGTDAIFNGEHLVYYEKALSANVLKLKMNVMQVIKDSSSGSA
ncbi:Uncharacterized protein BP5553_06600 [Venustampulla echinocandica]|uniref:Uncharacterized protein n=1 Tax=Venustampulla echinocandica TaxID=2656787 RepID=A0A370TKD8_9HELO|nr:Uncharacterized protein BP5553_06600 [Venustampulla echinocandica]RDL35988.1 Uncharacterized protein BP5553_06600 [Venustampulla echinocandica]